MLGLYTFYKRHRDRLSSGWLARLALLVAASLWIWLTWGRLYDPIVDQGWYLQAAARLTGGEVLYRDMIWMYGPLPVYLLAALFRWLGVTIAPFLILQSSLAIAGCLLTYSIARFLLTRPLALLGTMALFLGGWWGGFVGYTQAYTTAVPLGAVVGLAFVLCLFNYLRTGGFGWLVGAGLASGAATLIKPEFALACVGTGVAILTGSILFPPAVPAGRSRRWRALGVYALSAAIPPALGYGTLASRAGWSNVWVGITGYDQDALLLQVWPPWGTVESWLTIVSGLGVLLLTGTLIAWLIAPGAARKHWLSTTCLVGAGLLLALLPWRYRARLDPALIASMRSSWSVLAEQAIRVFWAPTTVLFTLLIGVIVVLWLRAHRRGESLVRWQLYLLTLALYSALANVRSFLHPTGTFHFLYLDTAFPVIVFAAAELVPRAVERTGQAPQFRNRAQAFVVVGMFAYAAAGLIWDLDYVSRMEARWSTPRGTVLYNPGHERRRAWPELLQYILTHSGPGEPIAVLGQEPGFYFWTARTNPLRQDTLLPGMASSASDAREIVRRFEQHRPQLIAIPQGVTYGRGWFWELEAGRQAYAELAPVWDYVERHYQQRAVLGGDIWGYAVYEPRDNVP